MSEYIISRADIELLLANGSSVEKASDWYRLFQLAHLDEENPLQEIVRCKDCAFYDSESPLPGCTQFDFSISQDMSYGFCAWGDRK